MNPVWVRLLWRLALCAALVWWGWRLFRAFGLLAAAPLCALALARPILDAIGALHHQAHLAAWADVAGYHHAYRGHTVRVIDDDQQRPWLYVGDVRRIVPGLPADEVLQRLVPGLCQPMGQPSALGMEAGALLAQLQGSHALTTLKFSQWLQREVLLPAERRRARRLPSRAPD